MSEMKTRWQIKVFSMCFIIFFVLALSIGFLGIHQAKTSSGPNFALNGTPIFQQSVDQEVPELYGNRVVWMQQGNDYYYKIFMGDLTTGITKQLGKSTAAEKYPAIWEDKVIWMDYRGIIDDPAATNKYAYIFKYYDMYGYDLAKDEEIPICTNHEWQGYGDIYENLVVYADLRTGSPDIILNDLDTKREYAICLNPAWQGNPVVFEHHVVWMDQRSGNYDIYGYDLRTGHEFPLCTAADNQAYPSIYGKKVVWQDKRNGNDDIYMYDLETHQETAICTNGGKQQVPDIFGNLIIWQDDRNGNWDIYGYNINTGEEFQVTDNPKDQTFPALYRNQIVWVDARSEHKNIYSALLPEYLIQAVETPKRESIAPTETSTLNNNLATLNETVQVYCPVSSNDPAIICCPVAATTDTQLWCRPCPYSTVLADGTIHYCCPIAGAPVAGTALLCRPCPYAEEIDRTIIMRCCPLAQTGAANSLLWCYPCPVAENVDAQLKLWCCPVSTAEIQGQALWCRPCPVAKQMADGATLWCCPIADTTASGERLWCHPCPYAMEMTGAMTLYCCPVAQTGVPELWCRPCPYPESDRELTPYCCPIAIGTGQELWCRPCPYATGIDDNLARICCPIPLAEVDNQIMWCRPCPYALNVDTTIIRFCCPVATATAADMNLWCQPCPYEIHMDDGTVKRCCPIAPITVNDQIQLCRPCPVPCPVSDTTEPVQRCCPCTHRDNMESDTWEFKPTIDGLIISDINYSELEYTSYKRSIREYIASFLGTTQPGAPDIPGGYARLDARRFFKLCGCKNVQLKINNLIKFNMTSGGDYGKVSLTVVAYDENGNAIGKKHYILFENPPGVITPDITYLDLAPDRWNTLSRSLSRDIPIDWCKVKALEVILTSEGKFPAGLSDYLEVYWDDLAIWGESCEVIQWCYPCPVSSNDPTIICCPVATTTATDARLWCKPCPYSTVLADGTIQYCCPIASTPVAGTALLCRPCPYAEAVDGKIIMRCCPLAQAGAANSLLWCYPCPVAENVDAQIKLWCCPVSTAEIQGKALWCRPCPVAKQMAEGAILWCCPIADTTASGDLLWCHPCPYAVEMTGAMTLYCCPVAQTDVLGLWCRPCPYPVGDQELTPYCCPVALGTGQELWCRPCPYAIGIDDNLARICCPIPLAEVDNQIMWCRPCPYAIDVDTTLVQFCCPVATTTAAAMNLWCHPCPYEIHMDDGTVKRCCPVAPITVNDQIQLCRPCPVPCPVSDTTEPVQRCCPCIHRDNMESDTWNFEKNIGGLIISDINYSNVEYTSYARSIREYIASFLEVTQAGTTVGTEGKAKLDARRFFKLCGCKNVQLKVNNLIKLYMTSKSDYGKVSLTVVAYDGNGNAIGKHIYLLFNNQAWLITPDMTVLDFPIEQWNTLSRNLSKDIPLNWCEVKAVEVILTSEGRFPAGLSDYLDVYWDDLAIWGENCEVIQWCYPCPVSSNDPTIICCPVATTTDTQLWCKPCPYSTVLADGTIQYCCPIASTPVAGTPLLCRPCPYAEAVDGKIIMRCCPLAQAGAANSLLWCYPCPVAENVDAQLKLWCCPVSTAEIQGQALWCRPCPVAKQMADGATLWCCPIAETTASGERLWCHPCPYAVEMTGAMTLYCCPVAQTGVPELWCRPCPYPVSDRELTPYCCPVAIVTGQELWCRPCPYTTGIDDNIARLCCPIPLAEVDNQIMWCRPCPYALNVDTTIIRFCCPVATTTAADMNLWCQPCPYEIHMDDGTVRRCCPVAPITVAGVELICKPCPTSIGEPINLCCPVPIEPLPDDCVAGKIEEKNSYSIKVTDQNGYVYEFTPPNTTEFPADSFFDVFVELDNFSVGDMVKLCFIKDDSGAIIFNSAEKYEPQVVPPVQICCPYPTYDPARPCPPCPVSATDPSQVCKPCPYAIQMPDGEIRYCCPVANIPTLSLWCQPCPLAEVDSTGAVNLKCCPLPSETVGNDLLWCRPCPLATGVDQQVQMWCCPVADAVVEGDLLWCRPCPMATHLTDQHLLRWCCPIAAEPVSGENLWCRPCPYVVEDLNNKLLTRYCCPVAQIQNDLTLWCRPCPYPLGDQELTRYCCPIALVTGQELWCRPCPLAIGVDDLLKQWCCPIPTAEIASSVLWCKPCPYAKDVDGTVIKYCCPIAQTQVADMTLLCSPCPYAAQLSDGIRKPCCPIAPIVVNGQTLFCHPCPVPVEPIPTNCFIGKIESIRISGFAGHAVLNIIDEDGVAHSFSIPIAQAEGLLEGDKVKVCIDKTETGELLITVEKYEPQVISPAQICCPYPANDPTRPCQPCPVTTTDPGQICKPCPYAIQMPDGEIRYCCPVANMPDISLWCQPCPLAEVDSTGAVNLKCCPLPSETVANNLLWCRPCPLATGVEQQVQMWCCPLADAVVEGKLLWCRPCPMATQLTDQNLLRWCCPIATEPVAGDNLWCRPCPYVIEDTTSRWLTRFCCPVAQIQNDLTLWCRPCPYPSGDQELTPYCCPIALVTGQELWCRPCPLASNVDEILKQWCCPIPTAEIAASVLWCKPCPYAEQVEGGIIQYCCPVAQMTGSNLTMWCNPCPLVNVAPYQVCCPIPTVTVAGDRLWCCPVTDIAPVMWCNPYIIDPVWKDATVNYPFTFNACDTICYRDSDSDGFGDPNNHVTACPCPDGYVEDYTDCNDAVVAINPQAQELCNGIDDNCDGQIDEGVTLNTYYRDADTDSYGNPNNSITACTPPQGYVTDNTDCNDNDNKTYPGANELCDGIDNNCDGVVSTNEADADGDWFRPCSGDCDDTNPNIYPGAPERADTKDNDCDGKVDESNIIVIRQDSTLKQWLTIHNAPTATTPDIGPVIASYANPIGNAKATSTWAVFSVVAGDFDNDGVHEIAVLFQNNTAPFGQYLNIYEAPQAVGDPLPAPKASFKWIGSPGGFYSVSEAIAGDFIPGHPGDEIGLLKENAATGVQRIVFYAPPTQLNETLPLETNALATYKWVGFKLGMMAISASSGDYNNDGATEIGFVFQNQNPLSPWKGTQILHIYKSPLSGYSGAIPPGNLIASIGYLGMQNTVSSILDTCGGNFVQTNATDEFTFMRKNASGVENLRIIRPPQTLNAALPAPLAADYDIGKDVTFISGIR